MRPYALEFIDTKDVELWRTARDMVEALPETDLGKCEDGVSVILSCHILARAIGEVFELQTEDGHGMAPGFEHSWCRTKNGNILDVYPIGMLGGPLLVDGHSMLGRLLYKKKSSTEISRGRFETDWFANAVKIVTSEISSIRNLRASNS